MKFHGDIEGFKKLINSIGETYSFNFQGSTYTVSDSNQELLNWNEETGTIEIKSTCGEFEEKVKLLLPKKDPSSSYDDSADEVLPDNFLGEVYQDSEVVIGLVGAVGSRLGELTQILSGYLKDRFGYDVEIVSVSQKIIKERKNFLDPIGSSEFERIKTFMDAGNALRRDYNDNSIVALDVAKVISEIRDSRKSEDKKQRVAYIVNSLKHDEEIHRLRQIYSHGFFQISLYESPQRRTEYLVKDKGMAPDQASELIQRDEEEDVGHGQHTRDAFHLADYFVKFDGSYDSLRNSCFRFLRLIFGDPFVTPTFDEFSIFMAFSSSLRSADLSRQVGAVIARDETVLATGANDIPKSGGGLYWPQVDSHTGDVIDFSDGRDFMRGEDSNSKEKLQISQEIITYIGNAINDSSLETAENKSILDELKEKIGNIVKSSKIKDITEYGRVVHAEMETLLACGRERISTKEATLYVTTFPCHNCAKHIIAAGVKRVVFVEPYPKSKALDFHRESVTLGFNNFSDKVKFEPFVGVGARNFLNLFSMSLGSGYHLKRKDKSGNALNWNPRESQLRTALLPYSYKESEKKAREKIDQLMSNVKTN